MLLTGSQIVIESLIAEGVDVVFGYPGGHVLSIYDALGRNQDRIRHVLTSHEQGASHAADGYARAGGRTGVCIATSGPGATNLVTGLATALADSVPLVALTGNVPMKFTGTDSFQEIDAISLTVAVTKHSFLVREISDLEETIHEAFAIARSGRPGPVLIDIPQDVQTALCRYKGIAPYETKDIENAETDKLEQAARLIERAKRPVLYLGGGIINGTCSAEAVALAERIDAPISCTMMGVSAAAHTHPLYLGMAGVYGRRMSSTAIQNSDLVIAAGVRFADRGTGMKEKFAPGAKIIHLDIDLAEKGKIIDADIHILGNLKHSLSYLLNRVPAAKRPQWRRQTEQIKKICGERLTVAGGFGAKEIIEYVNWLVPEDAVVATDVGQHQMWTAKYYSFSKPRTFLTSGGFGTMGYGMGAAIGAAVALGERTYLFTGDGSFHMNMNEIATAVRHKIPLTVVVLNNGHLGMISQLQKYFCEENIFSTQLGYATDFKQLADAMGAKGFRAESLEELKLGLAHGLKVSGDVVVIDCIISPEERAVPMMTPNGGANNMILR